MKTALKYLWICSLIILMWQIFSSYGKLPEKMATHFDLSGNPNGWSSKRGFFIGWSALIFGMNAMWLLSVVLIPRLLRKESTRGMLNIPNRDYWLETDERKKECARLINTMMISTAFLINLMLIVISHGIIQSNITMRVGNMWLLWVMTGIMLGFVFVYLFTAFRKPKDFTTTKEE